ncbi:MAG: hypothetical protein ACHQZR_08900, partial [Candidatus Limnocylindrales bacterium]
MGLLATAEARSPAPAGWTLVAPDDALAPAGVTAAADPPPPPRRLARAGALAVAVVALGPRALAASRCRLAIARQHTPPAAVAVSNAVATPLRLATRATLLLCLTTLGVLVTWLVVGFAGSAVPPPP